MEKHSTVEELTANFDGRRVVYPYSEIDELELCYATTIHESPGSEYPIVVMLKRNLIYTGVTRGKKARSDRGAEAGLGDGYAGKADGEAFDGPIALVEVR